jgi:21S rRNA (GM2251-2'-O)-methyltransferase
VDPQNIGAAIRSAYFLGATAVLLHGIDLKRSSQTVSRASAGVLEAWNQIYSTASLSHFLKASRGPDTVSLAASTHQNEKKGLAIAELGTLQQSNKVLVMGSEHEGVSKRVLDQCDVVTSIPSAQRGMFRLDSLNVSAATAILLHQLGRR